jgi:cardiolipin synthase
MGREYAGEDPVIGPWRDVQLEMTGAAARKFQMIFADDWFFATEEKLLCSALLPRRPKRRNT